MEKPSIKVEKPAIEKVSEALTGRHLGNGVALVAPDGEPHFATVLFGGDTVLSIDAKGEQSDIELDARPLGGLYALGKGRFGALEFGGDRLFKFTFENGQLKADSVLTVCTTPRILELEPGGDVAWILCRDAKRRLVRVDLSADAVEPIPIVGSTPADLALDASGEWLFVANLASYDIAPVNTKTRQLADRIPVGIEPYKLIALPGRDRMLVIHANNPVITAIDTQTRTVAGTLDIGASATRAVPSADGGAVFFLSPGGGKLIHVDPMALTVVSQLDVAVGAADLAWVETPHGGRLVLASGKTGDVQLIVPLESGLAEIGRLNSGSAAGRVYVGEDARSVWVTGPQAGRVARYRVDGPAPSGGVP